ncbi:hypothetical protein HWV62_37883 [Athelia sp. TMB]|nr:hypothetical protein HWV62_37883 [Athelia sp. TMB]
MLFSLALVASSFAVARVASAMAVSGATGPATPNYWFSFGDSYSTTGFSPSGTLPAPGNPLGNPAYPGNTGAGGSNWVDVCTTVYNASLLLTWNYAYSGATVDAALVAPYYPTTLSLKDQVGEFLAGVAAPWTPADALFSVWIGINDLGYSYYWTNGSRSTFADVLLDAEFGLVEKLMLASPASNQTLLRIVTDEFNKKLAEKVDAFEVEHPDFVQSSVYFWDAHAVFTDILDDLPKYGFDADPTAYGGANDFWG